MEVTYAKYKSFSKAAEILMSNQPNITHFMNIWRISLAVVCLFVQIEE